MKILITGVAGFIGSHVAERFAQMGHEVFGIDNFCSYYDPQLKRMNADDVAKKGVHIIEGDLCTMELTPIVSEADWIFHFAAQPGIAEEVSLQGFIENNIVTTHRILEVMKKVNPRTFFVNVSTSSVYGTNATGDENTLPKPTSYYGVTKLAAEQLALSYEREFQIPVCSVRMFSVYGPRERPDKLLPKAMNALGGGEPLGFFTGSEEHLRSFSFVDDIVDGFVLIFKQPEKCKGEIFNFGFDGAHRVGDILQILEKLAESPISMIRKEKRIGDQLRTEANITKAREILGFNPKTIPEKGIAKMFEWWKEKFGNSTSSNYIDNT